MESRKDDSNDNTQRYWIVGRITNVINRLEILLRQGGRILLTCGVAVIPLIPGIIGWPVVEDAFTRMGFMTALVDPIALGYVFGVIAWPAWILSFLLPRPLTKKLEGYVRSGLVLGSVASFMAFTPLLLLWWPLATFPFLWFVGSMIQLIRR